MKFQALRDAVGDLERRLRDNEMMSDALLSAVDPNFRASARNFVHYVTTRQTDLRQLQLGLLSHGLSSLGRLEGHVLDAITRVRERLDDALTRGDASQPPAVTPTWEESSRWSPSSARSSRTIRRCARSTARVSSGRSSS